MAELTIHRGEELRVVSAAEGMLLSQALSAAGFGLPLPCGGQGRCGRCRVRAVGSLTPPQFGSLYPACQTHVAGNAEVWLEPAAEVYVEPGSGQDLSPVRPMAVGLGCAVDLGTTTLALRLYDLTNGRMLSGAGCLNPQVTVAADVLGRVQASLTGSGEALRRMAETAIQHMLNACCQQAGVSAEEVTDMVVTGNSVMLHLLIGMDVTPLSTFPFQPKERFGRELRLLGRRAYLPPCISGFVGADTVCALLSSKFTSLPGTSLLCDAGTNGELALWAEHRLMTASTAAGPAFEGAGISCGMPAASGAIDRVWMEGSGLGIHVIGGGEAHGLCGSGLIDAIAVLRQRGDIDPTGACAEAALPLAGRVSLHQRDIRPLQLAKAAVAAGIDVLLREAGLSAKQTDRLLLAGGFGAHLPIGSAAAIGLFPAVLSARTQALGNAALDGAALLLADVGRRAEAEALADTARSVELGGSEAFQTAFLQAMTLTRR